MAAEKSKAPFTRVLSWADKGGLEAADYCAAQRFSLKPLFMDAHRTGRLCERGNILEGLRQRILERGLDKAPKAELAAYEAVRDWIESLDDGGSDGR